MDLWSAAGLSVSRTRLFQPASRVQSTATPRQLDPNVRHLPPPGHLTPYPGNHQHRHPTPVGKKAKGSPYSITERMVPELIPVLGSQPAGDVSHKPDGRLLLLSARPAVTLATLKGAATNFAVW